MHDSHIHMALSPLKENYLIDVQEFVENGGKKILVQATESSDYQETIDIVKDIQKHFPNVADLAIGIHPTIFGEAYERNREIDIYKYANKQISFFEETYKKNKEYIKAIGETGLDYFDMHRYLNSTSKQMEEIKEVEKISFRSQCRIAKENNLPLSIHSRDIQGSNKCTEDVLEILAKEGKGLLKGSFHSYTGSIEMIDQILDMGFYIGFNAIITYPSGDDVRDILRKTPTERILFETDGPFLPTQNIRKNKKESKRYGRPVLIEEIIQLAADIKRITPEKLEEQTDNNYITLFGS